MWELGILIYEQREEVLGTGCRMPSISTEQAKELIIDKGYRLYKRRAHGKEYISVRRGEKEYGLGRFNEEVWKELHSVMQPQEEKEEFTPTERGEILDVSERRGRPATPSAEEWRLWAIRGGVSSKSISWWEYLTQNGYKGSLSEFLNHNVEILFEEMFRLQLAVVRRDTVGKLKEMGFIPSSVP